MPLGHAFSQTYACITLIHMHLYSTLVYKGGMWIVLSYIRLFVAVPQIDRPQPLVPVAIQSKLSKVGHKKQKNVGKNFLKGSDMKNLFFQLPFRRPIANLHINNQIYSIHILFIHWLSWDKDPCNLWLSCFFLNFSIHTLTRIQNRQNVLLRVAQISFLVLSCPSF